MLQDILTVPADHTQFIIGRQVRKISMTKITLIYLAKFRRVQ